MKCPNCGERSLPQRELSQIWNERDMDEQCICGHTAVNHWRTNTAVMDCAACDCILFETKRSTTK